MTHVPHPPVPPRVPPVEPDLLASGIFLFGEYLHQLAAELPPPEEEDDGEDQPAPAIDTRQVLDLFAEELGTSVQLTLTLYMRVTAVFRLFAASPSLAELAMEESASGTALTDDALIAAARLDLHVARTGKDGAADFDPREFRDALTAI
jgi:hypothetical protein